MASLSALATASASAAMGPPSRTSVDANATAAQLGTDSVLATLAPPVPPADIKWPDDLNFADWFPTPEGKFCHLGGR